MKKLIIKTLLGLILLGASLPRLAFSEDYNLFPIGPFGTLDNTDNPIMVPNTMAQDLLNVEISKDGRYVKKREGYTVSNTLAITTSAVHGIYNFKNNAGKNVSLFFNDTRISASVNEGAVTVIYSTGPSGATYDCVDYNGTAYCVNTSSTNLFYSTGSILGNITPITANSTGTMITATPGRLVMAGNGANPNTVFFSKAYDFTTWTIGALDTDAIWFLIMSPGYRLTHITYAFGKVVWFKDSSFGYISEGETQADWQIVTINNNLGTLDNESVYWNGILYFRGNDYHFYSFDGSTLQRLSGDILATIEQMFSSQGSWEQTTSVDFSEGNYLPSTFIDTTTANGSIKLKFPDYFTDFRDGTSGTNKTWSNYNSSTASGYIDISGGTLLRMVNTGGTLGGLCTYTPIGSLNLGTTIHWEIYVLGLNVNHLNDFYLVLTTQVVTSPTNPWSDTSAWYFDMEHNVSGTYKIVNTTSPFNTSDSIINSTYSTSGNSVKFDLFISTNDYQLTVNDTLETSIKAGTHSRPNVDSYCYLCLQNGGAQNQVTLQEFGVYPQTTTFISSVKNTGETSGWRVIAINYQENGGTHYFLMRSSTTLFTRDSTVISWTAVTANSIPSISTGNYVQFRDDIRTIDFSDTPSLEDFTVNWISGAAPSDKYYAIQFDDKIWFSVVYGAAQTTNNRFLIYDILNNGWLIHDIPANGLMVKNNSLYFGSPTAGYIYKFGGTNSDNGSSISSYWKSKDFFMDNPFIEKEFPNLSFVSNSYANSYATVTYTLNGSSETIFQYSIHTNNSDFTQKNINLPVGKVGKTINIKYGNEAANQPWELFGIQIGWRPKPWKVTP